MQPDLVISIINHSNPRLLHDCLRSVFAHTHEVGIEVWVVDNATDGRGVAEMQAEFPMVRWRFNESRQGFSSNHNQILSQASGRYMCILNDDTIVHEGAFDRMVRYMDEHPEVGMLGAKLENPDGSIQNCTFRFWSLRAEIIAIALLPASMCHLKGDVIDPAQFSDRPAEVDWVLGACMVVRETTLRQIGGLDNELSPVAYMEEVDWCWRAHCAGWKVGYCPSAVVTHFGGQSTKHESAGADRMRVELCRTHVAYFRKHFGGGQALLLRLIYVLALPWNAMMVTQSLLRRRIGMRQYRSTLATSFQVATRVWRPENRRVKGGARGSS